MSYGFCFLVYIVLNTRTCRTPTHTVRPDGLLLTCHNFIWPSMADQERIGRCMKAPFITPLYTALQGRTSNLKFHQKSCPQCVCLAFKGESLNYRKLQFYKFKAGKGASRSLTCVPHTQANRGRFQLRSFAQCDSSLSQTLSCLSKMGINQEQSVYCSSLTRPRTRIWTSIY